MYRGIRAVACSLPTSVRATSVAAMLLLGACSDNMAPPDTPASGTEAPAFPVQLSDWQLMTVQGSTLTLHDTALPYDLATPLFSDYALKLRTVTLPEGSAARYDAQDSFDFPVGTVLSKTFYYPRGGAPDTVLMTEQDAVGFDGRTLDLDQVQLIETRLLVHENDGWHALPYIWDEQQQQATLQITGTIKRLTLVDHNNEERRFPYIVPNRNECAGCHAIDQENNRIQPLGPRSRHLNKTFAWYPQGPANQLQHWADNGLLLGLPGPPHTLPADPVWQAGATDDLDHRARAWLDVNCGHCHQPGAAADTSALFLHAQETRMIRMGRCKPPVAAGRGTGGNRFSIVPGEPEHSILVYRMASTDPGILMPELGRSLVHHSSVELISNWIAQLPGEC